MSLHKDLFILLMLLNNDHLCQLSMRPLKNTDIKTFIAPAHEETDCVTNTHYLLKVIFIKGVCEV